MKNTKLEITRVAYIIYIVYMREYGESLVIIVFFFQTFIAIINNKKAWKYISDENT